MSDVERINSRHREMMRRLLIGQDVPAIANAMCMQVATLKVIVKSPMFEAEMERLQDKADEVAIDVRQRLTYYADEALEVDVELMRESTIDAIRQRSCFDILDRAGVGKANGVPAHQVNIQLNVLSNDVPKGNQRLLEVLEDLTVESGHGAGSSNAVGADSSEAGTQAIPDKQP